jgi:hypothetical protein
MSGIENLMKSVSNISQKYSEIAKITGENFNVFKVLDVESDELSHSRILTDILNPNGSHGCDDIFLKLFFEKYLSGILANNFDFSKCQVYREYDTRDFGRIDIYINCQCFGVVIENKIYAGDQYEQLKRYDDFLAKNNFREKSHIFYLTLHGSEASAQSKRDVDEYKCLSYKNDILEWLKLCQKEVFNKPIIRETLEQYINLIKILTNQTRSNKMSEDIVKVIASSADNLEAAFEIGKNLPKAKEKIFNEKLREPLKQIAKERYNLDYKTLEWNRFKEGYENITIPFEKRDWKFYISLALCDNFGKLSYGVIGKIDNLKETDGFKFRDDKKNGVCTLLKEFNWNKNIFAELCKQDNDILKSFENKIEEILGFIGEKENAK